MMKRAWRVLLVVALVSCGESFDSGLMKARANDASVEGKAYAGPLGERLGPDLQSAMQRCFPSAQSALVTDFAIVFAVRGDGTPAQRMARPETPATKCVLDGIAGVRLPTPPRPDWWVVIEMKTTPEP
jgi:hypothetical protein